MEEGSDGVEMLVCLCRREYSVPSLAGGLRLMTLEQRATISGVFPHGKYYANNLSICSLHSGGKQVLKAPDFDESGLRRKT